MTNMQEFLTKIAGIEGQEFVFDSEKIAESVEKSALKTSNLPIKIVSLLGGLIGMVFFLACLGLAGVFSSEITLLFFGIIFLTGSVWYNRLTHDPILDTLLVALFVSGLGMTGFALEEFHFGTLGIPLVMLCIGLTVVAISQGYMLLFIATLLIGVSSFRLLDTVTGYEFSNLIYNTIFASLFSFWAMNEATILHLKLSFSENMQKKYLPILTGLVGCVLGGLFFGQYGHSFGRDSNAYFVYFYALPFVVAIFYALPAVLEKLNITQTSHRVLSFGLTALLLVFTLFSASVAGALSVILLCFYLNYRTGLILGIAAFLYFFGNFYYDLNVNLLTKSILMFFSGLFFLISYYFINKFFAINE